MLYPGKKGGRVIDGGVKTITVAEIPKGDEVILSRLRGGSKATKAGSSPGRRMLPRKGKKNILN